MAAAKIALPVAKCQFSILPEGTGSVEFVSESPGFDLDLILIGKGQTDIEAELSCDIHDDMALFLHTSRMMSRPNGVPLTQLNQVTSTLHIKETYEFSTSDATVITMSLFHVHGLVEGLLSSLVSGASVVLPTASRFSTSTFWTDIRTHRATWYTAVPTIHQILLERHATKPDDQCPELWFIRSCREATNACVQRSAEPLGHRGASTYARAKTDFAVEMHDGFYVVIAGSKALCWSNS